jgi:hypothetical protein
MKFPNSAPMTGWSLSSEIRFQMALRQFATLIFLYDHFAVRAVPWG